MENFFLVYNFSMQARQSFSLEVSNLYPYPKFDDQDSLVVGMMLNPLSLEQKEPENATQKDEPIIRGKGRPKGEKNSKQKQKKSKEIISDDNRRRGHWTFQENKRYHWFLEIYNKHFICKEMRRLDKIFKTMASFIGSREAEQCRSHHQKMEKKYLSFTNILVYLRKFHYGCIDQKLMEEDLLKNEIKQTVTFLNLEQLRDIESPKQTPPTPSTIEQQKQDMNECGGVMKDRLDFQQDFFDLLGQNYEHMLQIDDYLLF